MRFPVEDKMKTKNIRVV